MSQLSTETETMLVCLRKAVTKVLDKKRRLGQYAVVWRNGKVIKLEPEQLGDASIILKEDTSPYAPPKTED